ncbi:UNVERIFIED_CONTAM: hypothetical protein H355_015643 [Colinus virginianus]|nr:hypothetical protein H355_015643 [Colinus virginianus]
MVYHRRPGEEGAILTLAGKYTASKWVATLNVGYGGAHASYYHKANEQVSVLPRCVEVWGRGTVGLGSVEERGGTWDRSMVGLGGTSQSIGQWDRSEVGLEDP